MKTLLIIALLLLTGGADALVRPAVKPRDGRGSTPRLDGRGRPPLHFVARRDQESDAVKAANEAKAKRTATKPKVITNADVKKSKSKLTVTAVPATPDAPKPKAPTEDAVYRARKEASARVAAAEKRVAELSKSLDIVEQSFYAENDPNYRDDVIKKRFEQTKRQLDGARKELADARDALAGVK